MLNNINNSLYSPNIEKDILNFWNKNNIFTKSIQQRKNCDKFIFYDGPPFATGLPHYGHLLTGIIKDIIPRYQTMKGKQVERNFGWDCHGLPIEYEVEKFLHITSKKQIEKIGITTFNKTCENSVLKYTKEWQEITNKIGRWINFSNSYYTMDTNYMESIWWVFKQLWDKKLIYKGTKIVPYCPRCSTSLSNFEVNQGYKIKSDDAIIVKFQCNNRNNYYYLVWTTTPWTLTSNMALAVNPNVIYVEILQNKTTYILAENKLKILFNNSSNYQIIRKIKGNQLENREYIPIFPYFEQLRKNNAFKIVSADYVNIEDGTGIVHIATGFGEDDYNIGKHYQIPIICPIDDECRFLDTIKDYSNMYIQDTNLPIINRLKQNNYIFKHEKIEHNYPHCWRDNTPLVYKMVSTWFMKVKSLKQQLIEANQTINWIPSHIKNGRFGKWLENVKDWSIARNRYWGCPLPIWEDQQTNELLCISSIKELEQLSNKKLYDIHKHSIDKIILKKTFHRIPEIFDCWFESGAMPYAQKHYPFINKQSFQDHYPADFIAEGIDQTRGWFYTLTVLSVALFNKSAFKNAIVNGLIIAEDGYKMSKSKKNYPEPILIINKYGADALRLFLISSPCVRGINLKFSEKNIIEKIRNIILPIWNAYIFFKTYSNIDTWTPNINSTLMGNEHKNLPHNILDKWILSILYTTNLKIQNYMDKYNLQKAINCIELFIQYLTNWYIRSNRKRFWKSQDDTDKYEAYNTLHFVLFTLSQMLCPFAPFITEKIYQNLKNSQSPESVHLCNYPNLNTVLYTKSLETQMIYIISIISLGRQLRATNKIKNRQPLNTVFIVTDNNLLTTFKNTIDIIKTELNVKNVNFKLNETDIITIHAKPNFKTIGPKYGSNAKEIAKQILILQSSQIDNLLNNKSITFTLNNKQKINIHQNDILVHKKRKSGFIVATNNNITIALDIKITKELLEDGIAREFVNRIQNLRKEKQLKVNNRINIEYITNDKLLSNSIIKFKDYIKHETLANFINQSIKINSNMKKNIIHNSKCYISILSN